MRKVLVLAVGVGVALCYLASSGLPVSAHDIGRLSEPESKMLRVMTYNIQHGAGLDGIFDLDRTAAAIAAACPDVVGLQEVDNHWDSRSDNLDEAAALAAKLHMHTVFAQIYDLPPVADGAPDRQFGIAILSRYRITDAQNHQITRLPTVAADATPALAPGFLEVTIRLGSNRVHVYNTHLDYRPDPSVRKAQVSDMLAFLDHDPAPRILLGDFNAVPAAPELAPLLAVQTDAWHMLGQPHPPTWPSGNPTREYDYVTVSGGFAVHDARVLDTQASDHRPVIADLTVGPGARH